MYTLIKKKNWYWMEGLILTDRNDIYVGLSKLFKIEILAL